METKLYKIKSGFARREKWLVYFAAVVLKETQKALYLYGHGTTETARIGVCCNCGRTLTHPVSVELGIGPECGQHFHDWNLIGGYNVENLERLKGAMVDIKVEGWIPKSQVIETLSTKESIEVPSDHKMLNGNGTKKMTKKAKLGKTKSGEMRIRIDFPYDSELVTKVKTLPFRKYHPDHKCWSAPLSIPNVVKLDEWGFELCPKLSQFYDEIQNPVAVPIPKNVENITGLKKELFSFQKEGVAFIDAHNGRALIGDEMGLGKTIQALAWLQLHPEISPAIVVVPASLKLNWKREAEDWMSDSKVIILNGTTTYSIPRYHRVIIINYDILPYWIDELLKLLPKALITDESHKYKSNTAKRTKAVKKLAKHIPYFLALSGTPIINRPIEMFNAINLVNPNLFPNRWEFAHRYCGARHNGFGWDFNGATNTKELHETLTKQIMIRRLKKDVLNDLPEKIRTYVPLELDNYKEYARAELDFIGYIRITRGPKVAKAAAGAEALTRIEVLKQLAVKGKLEQAKKWIETFLESGEKLILFSTHRFVIDELMKEFGDVAVKVDGSVSNTRRDMNVNLFQKDPKIRLFIGNIQAAGVGITLTAASNVAFLELPWTPGELTQAEDRAHRIGQRYLVNIYYLLAEESIEYRIASLLDKKRKVLDQVLDGKDTKQENLLSELMNQYYEL